MSNTLCLEIQDVLFQLSAHGLYLSDDSVTRMIEIVKEAKKEYAEFIFLCYSLIGTFANKSVYITMQKQNNSYQIKSSIRIEEAPIVGDYLPEIFI
jgi:hypothetical protein